MPIGYCCLVLHAHLPFVRHPEYADCLEEHWLYEALTETYLPLLEVMEGWRRDNVDFRLTISLSPSLVTMLSDGLLQERYARHIARLIELAEKEVVRTRLTPELQSLARHYLERFTACRTAYEERYQRNLVAAFRSFLDSGNLEIMTCPATHGFLPLLQHQPTTVRAQVRTAVDFHIEQFGAPPPGIWNSECGYYPGLDRILAEAGLRYFFVDAHGLLFASERPKYGVFAPVFCPGGVAAFGRDLWSSHAVWSTESGYPGDPAYREFYRDIGFDLEFDYIAPYIHESGLRIATGMKYHRITGKVALGEKAIYDLNEAGRRVEEHASDFVAKRELQLRHLASLMDRPPLVTSPYDAELFGHWWYEGTGFVDRVMRRLCAAPDVIEPVTPSQYLTMYPVNQVVQPNYSSWGSGGHAEVWLDESNQWIYPNLHAAADRMIAMARRYQRVAQGKLRRALNQMARELLLAQSSDWAFIMKRGTVVDYAVRRTNEHLQNFDTLYHQIFSLNIDDQFLARLEERHRIFPNLQFELYAEEPHA
ncbi:MAG: DUF1957 domain-containing protein [bacterium]|nr:DUF1957 domain-containing protein [bacterium]